MSAYFQFQNLTVNDPAGLAEYRAKVPAVVEQFGGIYVVRGGDWETLEGTHRPPPVIFKFADHDAARRWYHSKEYRPLRDLRQCSATYDAALLTGLDRPRSRD
jgi:uncharacterized protein (DUF1330 family)